jgi:hypothetical protein
VALLRWRPGDLTDLLVASAAFTFLFFLRQGRAEFNYWAVGVFVMLAALFTTGLPVVKSFPGRGAPRADPMWSKRPGHLLWRGRPRQCRSRAPSKTPCLRPAQAGIPRPRPAGGRSCCGRRCVRRPRPLPVGSRQGRRRGLLDLMAVRERQQHPGQPPRHQAAQEVQPGGPLLGGEGIQPQHLAVAVPVHGGGGEPAGVTARAMTRRASRSRTGRVTDR